MTWTPLFSNISESSLWQTAFHIRVAWMTILSKADHRTHTIELNPFLLARIACMTQEQAKEALDVFQAPDPNSRSTVDDGRRLRRLEGNEYLIINADRYYEKMKDWAAREAAALRQAKYRESKKRAAENESPKEPDSKPLRNPAESCGMLSSQQPVQDEGFDPSDYKLTPIKHIQPVLESSAASKRFVKPSLDEVKLACAKCGLPESEAENFVNYYDSVGWVVGKKQMKSWQSALAGWKNRWQERQPSTALPKKKEISVFDSL